MSKDIFYKKQTNINFIVKNVSPQIKSVTIFGYSIPYGGSKNLLDIPDINEADIRDSLVKGDLGYKINNTKDLIVTSSSIDLMQYDPEQHSFLNRYIPTEYMDIVGRSLFGYTHSPTPSILDGINSFNFATYSDGVYTLKRDVFLGSGSTINEGITLYSAGFRIFCEGKLINYGIIHNDGKNASGATAGAASGLGSTGIGTAGGNGRSNNTGVAGSSQSNTLGDASCNGGAGGAGGVNAGGNGGTYNSAIATNGGAHLLITLLNGVMLGQSSGGNQAAVSIVGGGAGGGGGGSNNASATGGGGGGGGGVLILHAMHLTNYGIIRAAGGNGANATGTSGDAGGGGGGGGGIIFNVSRYREGDGVIIAPGGTAGSAYGSGVAGTAGSTGHLDIATF